MTLQTHSKERRNPLNPWLVVYDVRRSTTHLVSNAPMAGQHFSWDSKGHLYYSAIQSPQTGKTINKIAPVAGGVSSVFRYDPRIVKNIMLFPNGFRPTVSPRGNKLAFFAPERVVTSWPRFWKEEANYMSLVVSDLNGRSRIVLNTESRDYPQVVWSAHQDAVFTVKQIRPGPRAQLQASRWNLKDGRGGVIGLLAIQDDQVGDARDLYESEPMNRQDLLVRFQITNRLAEANSLLIYAMRLRPSPELTVLRSETNLFYLNLSDGKNELVATAQVENSAIEINGTQ